uniref:Apin n=1 Tax=Heterorhabditis bacteriophora TaxID=37862 RepID=A0A1I7XTK3_HETBA
MLQNILILLILVSLSVTLPSLNLLRGPDGYIIKEYINAITAYGPGLGVYSPYQYVDISYDNIPFVGKIPIFGKEGTSSRLGISPFYPQQGNPSNPFPPLYRARPLPLHVPEPQDVVAVPLDEEALHGEPLFPPELVLPAQSLDTTEEPTKKPFDPFGLQTTDNITEKDGEINWPTMNESVPHQKEEPISDERIKGGLRENIIRIDKVAEKSMREDEAAGLKTVQEGRPQFPFRSKRVRRITLQPNIKE